MRPRDQQGPLRGFVMVEGGGRPPLLVDHDPEGRRKVSAIRCWSAGGPVEAGSVVRMMRTRKQGPASGVTQPSRSKPRGAAFGSRRTDAGAVVWSAVRREPPSERVPGRRAATPAAPVDLVGPRWSPVSRAGSSERGGRRGPQAGVCIEFNRKIGRTPDWVAMQTRQGAGAWEGTGERIRLPRDPWSKEEPAGWRAEAGFNGKVDRGLRKRSRHLFSHLRG